MDVRRLINEVRSRPVLWDANHVKYKCHATITKQWKDIAKALQIANVDECRRKWKNLRDTYRACLNNAERQKEKSKSLGVYEPNKTYISNWVYLNEMSFIREFVRLKKSANDGVSDKDARSKNNSSSNSMDAENVMTDDGMYSIKEVDFDLDDSDNLHELLAIKQEFEDTTTNLIDESNTSRETNTTMYSDIENCLPTFQEIKTATTTTPPASKSIQKGLTTFNLPAAIQVKIVPKNSCANQPPSSPLTDNTNKNESAAALSQQHDQQQQQQRIHFLKNLEKEEEKLIKCTQDDMSSTASTPHHGAEDPDRNFLMSFLPHMKRMDDLQNLQFRSQMSQLILNIFIPPSTTNGVAAGNQTLPTLTPNPHLVSRTNRR
ncbi:uncharacterized protein LOC133326998 [Musca vetustissima]|uniref:uncharacterized protein LOC133326998 n=1 Tax=Musca vetustissima TaxID=27455 RepID=UPI002AB61F4D|nr:uncharacterized protein LOC133326998 [Musca vetustissima]